MVPGGRPGWALSDGTRAFFSFAPTRGRAAARELLGDYDGLVMADRYVVYESLEKARTKNGGQQIVLFVDEQPVPLPTPDYLLLACWMHARRGFEPAWKAGGPRGRARRRCRPRSHRRALRHRGPRRRQRRGRP